MARYTGPKCKLFRREGINVFDPNTSKFKSIAKKAYPPGAHGQRRVGKKSEYAKQLREKQKAKKIFGLLERQFSKYYVLASKSKDATGDAMLKLCERRIDNTIYRAGLANTRNHARQMVNHGLFRINNRRVNIPSILMEINDKIDPTDRARNQKYFTEFKKKNDTSPKWMKVDLKSLSIEITALPDKEDLDPSIDSKLIVEYYSK